jgi:hypothetical protein
MTTRWYTVLAAVMVAFAATSIAAKEPSRKRDATTKFSMQNVELRLDDTVVMQVARMHGEVLPGRSGAAPSFDDRTSLVMRVEGGEAAISTAAFSDLLNRYVFTGDDTPLSDIRVTAEGDHLKQEATLHKGVPVPVEMTGTLDVVPDGRVRFRPETLKAAGVPSKGLKDLLGLEMEDLVRRNAARGVTIEGDDMLMDVGKMVPPPRMQARAVAVRIEGDRVVQTFGPFGGGKASNAPHPSSDARNFIYYRGGVLSFGKLTMRDVDLEITDEDPADPLDFSLDHYYDQLIAGETRNLQDRGLLAVVPDYGQLLETRTSARH